MPRKQKRYHYIYKTTCIINNKYYIGMHSTDNLEDGYLGSGKKLWRSLNKHGRENHEIEFLEFLDSRKELKKREKEIVNESMLQDPMCMNLMIGGEGGFISDEQQFKRSKAGNIAATKSGKNVERRRWLWKNDLEWAKKISTNNSKSSNLSSRFKNKTHSEETKKKMSESSVGKGIGENNSQFGTCWIYNETLKQNKKIKKDDLEQYLNDNWIKGRKNKF